MNYDILNYRKSCEIQCNCSENQWEGNDLSNNYISFSNQISKIQHYQKNEISEEISFNNAYKTHLFNILIDNTPFNIFNKHYKGEFLKEIDLLTKLESRYKDNQIISKDFLNSNTKSSKKEIKLIEKHQNQMIDRSISKIIKMLLSAFKCNLLSTNNEIVRNNDIFKIIEESIKDLPFFILSKVINESHESSITEIKQFIHDIIEENANNWSFQNAVEVSLLLFTRIGGLDNILEWLYLVIKQINLEKDILIRTEILNSVLESLFIVEGRLNAEIKVHTKDCLEIDILDQEFIELNEAINFIFNGMLRACKIHSKISFKTNESQRTENEFNIDSFKDIYFWEHGKELETIKPPYPDSLLTRLNSSNESHSIKQLICSQTKIIVLDNLGQVRSKSIPCLNVNKQENTVKLFNQCWSPISFPDVKCKIEQISISFAVSTESEHVLALTHIGQVYSWGSGNFGKLGHGDIFDRPNPTLIKDLCDYYIVNISCGATHSSAVSETGLGFVWGNSIAFNGSDNENFLTPKRINREIISNIICGSNSTFFLNFSKQKVYYLGSQYEKDRLYKDNFILKSYPSMIEGLPIRKYHKNEQIKKIAVNSSGMLVLLDNGELYSIGYGLVLGCPNCQVHEHFEKVECMSRVNVIDVSLTETHAVILSHNVIYSWSLTTSLFILVEEPFNYALTSISSLWLVDSNKSINIAWSKNSKNSKTPLNLINQNENSYLSIISSTNCMEYFCNILSNSFEYLNKSQYFEQLILNTLKLFLQCIRSDQFQHLIIDYKSIKPKIDKFLDIILIIGDQENICKKINEVNYNYC